jgi:4-alpha-glucanotransferase
MMPDDSQLMNFPPFPAGYRASGLLLHVTSLPSPYGIGDLGSAAFAWIDHLREAGQSWWQALPLGPTGYGDSPYQPLSSFAGNGMLISPEGLIEDGLLRAADCEGRTFSATSVDYDAVIPFKQGLLDRVWARFKAAASADLKNAFEKFREDQGHWLEDYALFRALKNRYNGAYYLEWPPELVRREPAALAQAKRELAIPIDQVCLAQFLVFRQWAHLRSYAEGKGVRLIGDLPFYVSPDSSDVWVNPELFLLDELGWPRIVAGVPPDYFTAHGQLWGNPTYDWDVLRQTGFRWCIERLRAVLTQVDVIRLDHFRAFSASWHVPAGAPTAQTGEWVLGPGAEFFRAVERALGGLPFIAEDLGVITPDVSALRIKFKLPGTRVLQFAFDGAPDNRDLPHHYVANTAVYTGTHDNPTTRSWYENLPDEQRSNLWNYLKRPEGNSSEAAPALMHLAWSSKAALAMAPLQDVLNLGADARMNTPGQAHGNWRWRFTEDTLSESAFEALRDLTEASGRAVFAKNEAADPVMEAAS